MKKNYQNILIALVAMVMPIGMWAQDITAEAKWGNSTKELKHEGTLAEAIATAEDSKSNITYIQLQSNVTTEWLEINSDLRIDLNSKILTTTGIVIQGSTVYLDGNGHLSLNNEGTLIDVKSANLFITGDIMCDGDYGIKTNAGSEVTITGNFVNIYTGGVDFYHGGGTLNLSEYDYAKGATLYTETNAIDLSSSILLPEGGYFYDYKAITQLTDGSTFSIGIYDSKWDTSKETTEIDQSELTTQNTDFIYDFMGSRVMTPQKSGIYIVDGKKVKL